MPRAKRGLYFTSAEDYGGARRKKLSRFMIELGYQEKIQKSNIKNQNEFLAEKPVALAGRTKIKQDYLPGHFSFSQLAAFEKCPLQYKFAFILRVPVKGKASFSFGKTMHNTLHDFLRQANEKGKDQGNLFGVQSLDTAPAFAKATAGKQGELDSLIRIYEKNWIGEWYENKKQKEEYYKLGKEIIKDFYSEFSKNPPKILKINNELALEMPFNLKINGYTLRGVIDRIDELDDGVVIIDYKTGNSKEKLETDDKEQLLIYQIAAKEVFGIKPKELAYYYLNDNKKQSFLGRDVEIEKMKEKIN